MCRHVLALCWCCTALVLMGGAIHTPDYLRLRDCNLTFTLAILGWLASQGLLGWLVGWLGMLRAGCRVDV
jgi:hypothetical protein